ncbi:uncharacterized protein LOC106088078 [Stomoxys calcitrans]|uniref:uncharacterized protein LOC106088078 n=1 Tax=Stomoxys calcitrans TaxID=35570 RepID=UPI0027E25641|nr:uncharacterized protein LOC106088078 [Stomoxys calcitrans]
MTPKGRFSQEFDTIFPEILQDLKETLIGYGQKETFDSLARGLEYNLQNAEQNIALLTMLTYEQMVKAKKITSPDYRLASILGWCGEILNAGILICDDVLDRGQMRRSLPSWYTLENVGLNAVTDAFLLHQFVFLTLTKHCRHLHCYTSLMELFHEVCFRTACGKSMDVACTRKSLNEFNLRDYKTMAVNKATFYNFYLPFALSMHLAG